jgi:hypothetical protein
LIVPDVDTTLHARGKRSVIGLSGPIAAGKTTAGDFLKLSGFHYGRFSLVLADILCERGIKPSRESLQQIGEEVNKNPGQRWLGQELVRRLPDDGDLVIDGLRFPEDHAFLVETFGPASAYSLCPKHNPPERSISARRVRIFSSHVSSTEANVRKLTSLAHFIVPNVNGSEPSWRRSGARRRHREALLYAYNGSDCDNWSEEKASRLLPFTRERA